MLQYNLQESHEAATALRELLPEEMLFKTAVPRDDIYIRASAKGLPVAILEGGEISENVFDSIREEIQAKLNINHRQPTP
jgi:hypothetical protein